jgi:hypothetical protein
MILFAVAFFSCVQIEFAPRSQSPARRLQLLKALAA